MLKRIFFLIFFFSILSSSSSLFARNYSPRQILNDVTVSTAGVRVFTNANVRRCLNAVYDSTGSAIKVFFEDGPVGAGDNLGNHIATTTLDMSNYDIINVSTGLFSGNIGIGETQPESSIHISTATPYITLKNSTLTDGDGDRESFIVSQGLQSGGELSTLGKVGFLHDGVGDDQRGRFAIFINDGFNGPNPNEAFRMNHSGEVVLGGASLTTLGTLTVAGTNCSTFLRRSTISNSNYLYFRYGSTNNWRLGTDAEDIDLNLYSYGASENVLTILDSNGNIGIGTTNPTRKLEINGNIKTASINISTSNQLLFSSPEDLYWGRTQLSGEEFDENFYNFGDIWTVKESSRDWVGIAMSADGSRQTAVVDEGQIYVSTDFGNIWTVKESSRGWLGTAMSADGSHQTAVVSPGQIYISTDFGDTWVVKESTRNWIRVAMSADGAYQTAVENGGQIYISTDSGNTWTPKESNRGWYGIAMSADGSRQTAVAYDGQIYISTDSGNIWTVKESSRNWTGIAMSADGSRQTAIALSDQIYISTDFGDTWVAKESSRGWVGVAVSADASRQTAVEYGGQIYVSADYGNIWTARENSRYWTGIAMSADGSRQTAVDNAGQIYVSITEKNKFSLLQAKDSDGLKLFDDDNNGIFIEDGGNIGIGTTTPETAFTINGIASYSINSSTQVVYTTSTVIPSSSFILIVSTGGAVTMSASIQISTTVATNFVPKITLVGTSDTDTVTFIDGNGLYLDNDASMTLGIHDKLDLDFIPSFGGWIESNRRNN